MSETRAPSSYRLEQAMSALQAAQARLIADGAYDEDETAFAVAEADVETLLHRAVRTVLHAESMVKAAKDRIEAVKARQTRYEKRAETMRGAVFAAMDALGRRKLELPDATVSIGAGRATSVITDETIIPEIYFETKRQLNKTKLNADLKEGLVIDGAELANGIPTLTIRTL